MIKRHARFVAATVGVALTATVALVGFSRPAGVIMSMTRVSPLRFDTLARVGLPLSGLVWTGSRFVYTVEGQPQLYTSAPDGKNLRPFTRVPRNGGEMRCVESPSDHGWPAHTLYCHAADGPIYRIASGGAVAWFATVQSPRSSDGALAFDTVGRFGYALLAATGGSDSGPGGDVYAITPKGATQHVGHYNGPGGAENVAIAPAGFGSAAGQALISVDQHDHHGRLLAMDAHGVVRTLVGGLPWGLDPIAPLVAPLAATGGRPSLYVADWLSHAILVAPGDPLAAYRGAVLVTTERHGYMYVVRPNGTGYVTIPIRTNLRARDYNLEGAAFLTP